MAYNAIKVNDKSFAKRKYFSKLEWTPENRAMVLRSDIKEAAKLRFNGQASIDDLEPFLVQFNAWATSPKDAKDYDSRLNYRTKAMWSFARDDFGILIPDSVLKRIDNKTPLVPPTPAEIGAALKLTWDEREAGKLWRILPDIDEDEFDSLRREKARIRRAKYRRRSGVRTRAQYRADVASKNPEPWTALGIAKATYYRRQKAARLGASQPLSTSNIAGHTESHGLNHSIHSKNHIGHVETERSEGADMTPLRRGGPRGERKASAASALAPNHNEGVAVLAPKNPKAIPSPVIKPAYPNTRESIVVHSYSAKTQSPAAARTDDNEAAILAEAKRILANLPRAEAERVAA